MASITLINLIPNPSMNSGWDVAYVTPTTTAIPGGFGGGYPLQLVGTTSVKEKSTKTTTNIPLIPNHIYYTRVYGYQETQSTDATFGFYWPIAEPSILESIPTKNAGYWQLYSAVNNRKDFTEGSYPLRIDFNNNFTATTAWISSPMLIDLTISFGEGNEPTKEWCDEHIPFFSGTRTFDKLIWKLKDITPVMTNNTTPAGYIASASSEVTTPRQAWCAFDNLSSYDEERDRWHSGAGSAQWIMLKFPEKHKVIYFSIKNCGEKRHTGIKDFTLQGSNNGSTFVDLGSYTNPETAGVTTQYKVTNPGDYQYYRLNISSTYMMSGSSYYSVIDQIRFYEAYLEGYTKVDGAWKPFYEALVKVNGKWNKITSIGTIK